MLFAGSMIDAVYSFVLALVLSHIADAEEEELRARFGEAYVDYEEGAEAFSECRD